jgi:hypothetical protein
MKIRLYLTLYHVLQFTVCLGQLGELPVKWGKIAKDDFDAKIYSVDSTASAVILFKYGIVHFVDVRGRFQLQTEYLVRIKILNTNGYNSGNIEIPYYAKNGYERFSDFKAHTLNLEPDGKIKETNVKNELIFDLDIDGFFHQRKFAFPDIRTGSILEYRYTIVSDDFFTPRKWNFQDEIPVIWSEYRTLIPDIFTYTTLPLNIDKYDLEESGNSVMSIIPYSNGSVFNINVNEKRYVIKDLKQLREEPFLIEPYIYGKSMDMQLNNMHLPERGNKPIVKDQIALGNMLLEADWFGDNFNHINFLKDITNEVTKGASNPNDKIKLIYDYVKNQFSFNDHYSLYIYDLKKTFNRKIGNSSEINAILLGMLRNANIDAEPIVVCTRNHGLIQKFFCMVDQLNHFMIQLKFNDEIVLIDATDSYRPIKMLDYLTAECEGLLLKEDKSEWIPVNKINSTKSYTNINLSLKENGKLSGKGLFSCNNYRGLEARKEINKKGEKDFLINLIDAEKLHLKIDSVSLDGNDSINNNLTIQCIISQQVQTGDKNIYITPFINADLHVNPLKNDLRETPVEFLFTENKTSLFSITVPTKYAIVQTPHSTKIRLPDNSAAFTFIATAENNIIQIKSVLEINRLSYLAEEYPEIKEFFANISKTFSEQIVLEVR